MTANDPGSAGTHPVAVPPSRPMILTAAGLDGQVLGAWQMDAHTPGGLVVQIAELIGSGGGAAMHRLNPGRFYLVDRARATVAARGGVWETAEPNFAAEAATAAPGNEVPWLAGVFAELRVAGAVAADLVGADIAAAHALRDVFYRGDPDGKVAIRAADGTFLAALPNAAPRKSPTGFGWGYAGSGPATLARSLLVAAIGPDLAACPACAGTRKVVCDDDGQTEPWRPGSYAADVVQPCHACDDGIRHDLPYQDYKETVIALLDDGQGWTIPRVAVIDWLRNHAAMRGELAGSWIEGLS